MSIIKRKKYVTGIHIGVDTVRFVQFMHNKTDGILTACSAAISPLQGYFNSVEKTANTVDAIKTCKNNIGRKAAKTDFTISCLNWPDVIITAFDQPQMPSDELEQALIFEIEQICPFDASSAVVDYHLIDDNSELEESERRIKGVLVVCPQNKVYEHFSMLKKSGLKHTIVDADSIALLNCYERLGTDENAALVNIDMSHTIVAMQGKKTTPFMRNIDYGGKDIINNVFRDKGIAKEEFAGALRGDAADLSSDVLESLAKSCEKLAKSITTTLQYYIAESPESKIEKVLLTGEMSLMPIVVDFLSNEIDWDLKVWNPFDSLDVKEVIGRNLLEKTGSAFAIAAGLAVRNPEYV